MISAPCIGYLAKFAAEPGDASAATAWESVLAMVQAMAKHKALKDDPDKRKLFESVSKDEKWQPALERAAKDKELRTLVESGDAKLKDYVLKNYTGEATELGARLAAAKAGSALSSLNPFAKNKQETAK